ncbi:NUDIX hydrolase [Rubricoccus marinus]|uniref:Nudix hydrolase domain-containing protein n=1 Tax=Rubricoccus marinus TaxID=716817 RepID=A0A259U1T5_9BACT|nr:NUDIX hydrolase [Rubricoccus marinus]OZC03900.1 hypothetical protein BSZ36_13435 [Rubricoccus marinus]
MLLYAVTYDDPRSLTPKGLSTKTEPFWMYDQLPTAEHARRSHPGRPGWILVLDRDALDLATSPDGAELTMPSPPVVWSIPREAILNVDADGDYWRPYPVVAAGGFVVRRSQKGNIKLLLIKRRGKWDLPKGKEDPGETPVQAARREVSEEVGVKKKYIEILHPLGHTIHGYIWHKRGVYAVKTTHWFSMTTEAREFIPEKGEGIKKVKWMKWAKAGQKLGYKTLRQHHAILDPEVLGV